ncbi:hypothetical protein [Sphingomonas melonis]|uniref:hypothetical protein n=1 Tax=Sphingomonas melonis TaxID=152682 RepID=UPI0015C6C3BC|nr:hypothetical protein [Sphingomonas melonis]
MISVFTPAQSIEIDDRIVAMVVAALVKAMAPVAAALSPTSAIWIARHSLSRSRFCSFAPKPDRSRLMTSTFRPVADGFHAFAKDSDSVVLRCDGLRVPFGDMLEQSERNGGVAAGGGAQGHVGVEHRKPLDDLLAAWMAVWRSVRKACSQNHSPGQQVNRFRQSECAFFSVGSCSLKQAMANQHPPARIVSPVPGLRRSPLCGTDAGVIATSPETRAVTPTLVIVRHRRTHDLHDLAEDRRGRAVQHNVVQPIERVEESVNHMVRHLRVAHRIDDRRRHVCERHHGDPYLGSSFSVFHHAAGIAA